MILNISYKHLKIAQYNKLKHKEDLILVSVRKTLTSLSENSGFKRYFFNTGWLFAEQILRMLSGLFVGVWVARYLGPEQFGIYSYALAFTAIFAGIAKLGLDSIIVRELINHPEKSRAYLGTGFWLKFMGAFLVIGLIISILPFTNNDPSTKIFILIIAFGLVFQSFEVVEFLFQSKVLAKNISISKIIQLSLSSIFKIYLVFSAAELIWFVVVILFDALVLALCYFFASRKQEIFSFYKKFDLAIAGMLLKDSWPLILASIVTMIYMRIDQIMIKEMLSEYDVGIYSASVRLSEAFYFIPTVITASLFPAILNSKNKDEKLYKKRLNSLYTMLVWIAIAIALVITLFRDELIMLLYGKAYHETGVLLMIHSWASIFVFLGVANGYWFIAENLQRYILLNTCIGAFLNVGLNLVFLSKFGVIGAAYSTIISYFVAAYFINAFWKVSRPNFIILTKSLFLITNHDQIICKKDSIPKGS